jgi:hypothetical protein
VTPPTVVPPKDGIDEGHDGDDNGDSCHHHDDQTDEHGHDGYDSPDGTSHGDGESASDGSDHGPKHDGDRHDDPPKAETEHANVDASISVSGVVGHAPVGALEGG